MFKFFKLILKLFLGLIIIVILGCIGVGLFVNPNQFKSTIEETVLAKTGHVLNIKGPLSWKWFPMLSLELQDVTLQNTPPFENPANPLFSAKALRTEVEPLGLLAGKLAFNIKLDGFNVILERNCKGQTNWDTLKQNLSQPKSSSATPTTNIATPTTDTTTPTTDTKPPTANRTPQILFNGISAENGQIIYHDEESNKHYMIDHLSLKAENLFKSVIGGSNPISLGFHIENLNKKPLGNLSLTAVWSLNPGLTEMNIKNVSLKFQFPDGKTTELNGEAEIQNLKESPTILGKIESPNFNIKPWLADLGITDSPALPSSANIKLSFKYLAPQLEIAALNIQLNNKGTLESNFKINLDNPSLLGLQLQGQYTAKQLQIAQFQINELKGNIGLNQGVLSLAPMDIQIAGSAHHATLSMDLRGENPKYTLTQEGHDFDINSLLTLFNNKDKLDGKTRYNISLTASGTSLEELRRSAAGQANFEIVNGHFHGINLIGLLKSTQTGVYTLVSALTRKENINIGSTIKSQLDQWKTSPTDPNAITPFNNAKASMTIMSGIVSNPDLSITHTDYSITGKGTFNLINEAIQYQTSALYKNNPYPANDEIANFLIQTPLTIQIGGTLNDPSIRPELNNYVNSALAFGQKNVVEKFIDKTIDKTFNKLLDRINK